MLLEISIKSTILWTCVIVFIATSIITLMALVKIIRLAEDVYLKRLFYALILEIVAISVWGFGDVIKGGSSMNYRNYVKIINPAPWPWNPGNSVKERTVFINGIVFKEKDDYMLIPKVFFNQKEYKTGALTFNNEIFTTNVTIPGDTSGNLTINMGLYSNNNEKPLKADEVVTPVIQTK
jgi:hypothetical protein